MHPNEEMIHSDAELMCGRVSFHPHRVVSVYIRGMEPNHFHPRPLPPDSSLSRCSVSPAPTHRPPFHSSEKQTCRVGLVKAWLANHTDWGLITAGSPSLPLSLPLSLSPPLSLSLPLPGLQRAPPRCFQPLACCVPILAGPGQIYIIQPCTEDTRDRERARDRERERVFRFLTDRFRNAISGKSRARAANCKRERKK